MKLKQLCTIILNIYHKSKIFWYIKCLQLHYIEKVIYLEFNLRVAYFVGGFNDVGKYVDFTSSSSTILWFYNTFIT